MRRSLASALFTTLLSLSIHCRSLAASKAHTHTPLTHYTAARSCTLFPLVNYHTDEAAARLDLHAKMRRKNFHRNSALGKKKVALACIALCGECK
jgi:hypothetical protein